MEVKIHNIGTVKDEDLKFAVIWSFYEEKLLLVRHKERDTWEIPGGKREPFETIDETAKRELFEETGAVDFEIKEICYYSVKRENEKISFGSLFYCKVKELGSLPEMEIGEVKTFDELPSNLTYPEIYPCLYKEIINYIEEIE